MLEITEQNLACQAQNILKIKRLSKGQMESLRRQILVQGTEQENVYSVVSAENNSVRNQVEQSPQMVASVKSILKSLKNLNGNNQNL